MQDAVVINLPRRLDRKAQFLRWNAARSLAFNFFAAVDGKAVDRAALPATTIAPADIAKFTAGALGCALSHGAPWRRARDRGKATLIVEDDCCLAADFGAEADRILGLRDMSWDIIYFGYNTDGGIAVELQPGLPVTLDFRGRNPRMAWLDRFSAAASPPPALHRVQQLWGALCYAVSPRGAQRLTDSCFPLSRRRPVRHPVTGAPIQVGGLDAMINLAIEDGNIEAYACIPPVALGPNDRRTSDVMPEHPKSSTHHPK